MLQEDISTFNFNLVTFNNFNLATLNNFNQATNKSGLYTTKYFIEKQGHQNNLRGSLKGPQSRILHAKMRSSMHAPAHIEKKGAIPARSRVSATLELAGMAHFFLI